MPTRPLPDHPNLRHLKDQAKDLLQSGGAPTLAAAQFQIARGYGFPSWPKLKVHVETLGLVGPLKSAIDANDLASMQSLMTQHPALHTAPLGYRNNGPLTWAAECRGGAPAPERLEIARWMIEHGSDVHQGGDGPLMRAALDGRRIPMMELLVACGADVNARAAVDEAGTGGQTPLFHAATQYGDARLPVVELLLARGADLRIEARVAGHYESPGEVIACTALGYAERFPGGESRTLAVLRAHAGLG